MHPGESASAAAATLGIQCVVEYCQECNARGVRPEHAWAHVHGLEAMRLQQLEFELVPAALGADGQQATRGTLLADPRRPRPLDAGMRDETRAGMRAAVEEAVQFILDQRP